ncbi:MAG: hypothetical protein GY832_04415 [Chloroflexi bacterium]|nr:hypothetical protein [Chloroflexota bacterium]
MTTENVRIRNKRILIAVVILIVIVGAVLGVDALRRHQVTELEPGSVPIYFEDRFVESFKPDDLERLDAANFGCRGGQDTGRLVAA